MILAQVILLILPIEFGSQSVQRAEYHCAGVKFIVQVPVKEYRLGDTAVVFFEINNQNQQDIYVFDVLSTPREINRHKTFFRYGSAWLYRPGHGYGGIRRIKSKSKFFAQIPCIVRERVDKQKPTLEIDDMKLYEGTNEVRELVFRGSFCFAADGLNLVLSDLGPDDLTFSREEDGYFFEANLIRFTIGSLELKILGTE